jgi:hypothetical protein
MPHTKRYDGPKDLVYHVNEEMERVVFADRETALYVSDL